MRITTIIILNLLFNIGASAEPSKESTDIAYYRNANNLAWRYGTELAKKTKDPERSEYERDLSAYAFSYWILLKNDKISRNHVLESNLKNAVFRDKVIRPEIIKDPLGWTAKIKHPRGLSFSGLGLIVSDDNYEELAKGFNKFIEKITD